MIEQEIKKRAESYTPEWNYDPNDPDVGAAVAKAFIQMMKRSAKKFGQLSLKNRIAFLNELGADLLPGVCADGFVQFSLVSDEMEGIEVAEGTRLFAEVAEEETGRVTFLTTEPIFVSPASIDVCYVVDTHADTIYEICDEENHHKAKYPLKMFSRAGENRQEHICYIALDNLLTLAREATIVCDMGLEAGRIHAEYYTQDGWNAFADVRNENGGLVLRRSSKDPAAEPVEINGLERTWMRISQTQMRDEPPIDIAYPSMRTESAIYPPDTVYHQDMECDRNRFLAFGENLMRFDEVYFASDEVLKRHGARITFSFRVDFVQLPLETNDKEVIDWQWIMERSEFRPVPEYDVSIAEVTWEYFNGNGWARLHMDADYKEVFSYIDGQKGRFVAMSFICPQDMTHTLGGASDSYFIRARILRVNNLYKLKGQYILPVLENVGFSYCYEAMQPVETVLTKNNLTWQKCRPGEKICPYHKMSDSHRTMYLGFTQSPEGFPFKWYVQLEGTGEKQTSPISFEAWNGKDWRVLHPADTTAQLSKSGEITFAVRRDIEERELFGKKRYWIRIVDAKGAYERIEPPVIKTLYRNVARVVQMDGAETETFRMDRYRRNAYFDLLFGNVQKEEVYVDETGQLAAAEAEDLKKNGLLQVVSSEDEGDRFFVKWTSVEDFSLSGPTDRHYVLQRRMGRLQFGDGVYGRIPEASVVPNISVSYVYGGGSKGNLAEGTIKQMDYRIGFINEVANPAPTVGGCDEELPEDAIVRMTDRIVTQNRAVTCRDFERLAYAASRMIAAVKVFTDVDENGAAKKNAVTLVVLDRAYANDRQNFEKISAQIHTQMKDKISPALKAEGFFVCEPEFVECSVSAEIVAADEAEIFAVRRAVYKRLMDFIRPAMRGERGGFTIGQMPNILQLQNEIFAIPGVKGIQGLSLRNLIPGTKSEIDARNMPRAAFVLPISGIHDILVTTRAMED